MVIYWDVPDNGVMRSVLFGYVINALWYCILLAHTLSFSLSSSIRFEIIELNDGKISFGSLVWIGFDYTIAGNSNYKIAANVM